MPSTRPGQGVRIIALALAIQLIDAEGAQAQTGSVQRGPTAQEYVRAAAGDARMVPAGELVLDGHRMTCGHRPTVLHSLLDDYGAAYPGFIILNPRRLEKVSTPVKLWIYSHECGHQFRGPDEQAADCFAVQRGRRLGWLTLDGLEQVCRFMAPAKATSVHFSGVERCQAIKECYTGRTVR